MTTRPTVEALAAAFSSAIRDYLTPSELAEANRRNEARGFADGVCHTQDFCDANDAMLYAWESVTDLGVPDFDDEEDCRILNAAWRAAKAARFAL